MTTDVKNEMDFTVPPQEGATRTGALLKVVDVLEAKAEREMARVERLVEEKREREERARREAAEKDQGNVSKEQKDGQGGDFADA